jgi:hypothetical protein
LPASQATPGSGNASLPWFRFAMRCLPRPCNPS